LNQEEVLAVLPGSKEEAKSIKEIAQAMGIEITTHMDWVRTRAAVVRALGALVRWGWVACDERRGKRATKFGTISTGRRSWRSRSGGRSFYLGLRT
jgi:DNA-binding IclR family transcriptional regulator